MDYLGFSDSNLVDWILNLIRICCNWKNRGLRIVFGVEFWWIRGVFLGVFGVFYDVLIFESVCK